MRSRRLVVPISLVVLATSLGAGWAVSRGTEERAPFVAAVDVLPAATVTVDFTRWADVRGMLEDASLRGATTRSVLADLDAEMREQLDWSATDLDWEVHGRIGGGAVTAFGLGDVSVPRAERSFAAIGSAVDAGTWRIEGDFSSGFAATFAWVRILADRDVVLAAPDQASLDAATDAATGEAPSLLDDPTVGELADRLGAATSVLLQNDQVLCSSSSIDDSDVESLQQLTAALGPDGRLDDPVWGGRGLYDSAPQRLIFLAAFATEAMAREQTQTRQALTEGPFIGRPGQVADSLQDLRVSTDDGLISFDFELTDEGEQFMTDTGPVVFAGCASRSVS